MNLIVPFFMAVLAVARSTTKICRTKEPIVTRKTYPVVGGYVYLSHHEHVKAWRIFEELLGQGTETTYIRGVCKIRWQTDITKVTFITTSSEGRDEIDGSPVTLFTMVVEDSNDAGKVQTVSRHFYARRSFNEGGTLGELGDIVEKSVMDEMARPCYTSGSNVKGIKEEELDSNNREKELDNNNKNDLYSEKQCKDDAKERLNAICTNYCNKCHP